MIWTCATALCSVVAAAPAVPPLAGDVPPDADVIVRLAPAELSKQVDDMASEFAPVAALVPTVARRVDEALAALAAARTDLEELTHADLSRADASLTLAVDLDAVGGIVWAVVVRDAWAQAPTPSPPSTPPPSIDGAEQRQVDGDTAWVLPARDRSWALSHDASNRTVIVYGNERGVQRQLRHLRSSFAAKSSRKAPTGLGLVASSLRDKAPVMAAAVLTGPMRSELLALVGRELAPLLGSVEAITVRAHAAGFAIECASTSKEGSTAVVHALRGGVASLQALGTTALATLELLRAMAPPEKGGSAAAARRPADPKSASASASTSKPAAAATLMTPPSTGPLLSRLSAAARRAYRSGSLDGAQLDTIIDGWLRAFRVDAVVQNRPGNRTEVDAKVSSWRGVAAALLMGFALAPSESGGTAVGATPPPELTALLQTLLLAELAYHKRTGAYLECGPVPAQLPSKPALWPTGSCFAALEFAPPMPMWWQVQAAVEGGRIVLTARADPDGDSVPEVWTFDERSRTPRRVDGDATGPAAADDPAATGATDTRAGAGAAASREPGEPSDASDEDASSGTGEVDLDESAIEIEIHP